MSDFTAADYDVTILFNPAKIASDPFTFAVNKQEVPAPDFKIEVTTNVAVIHFYLVTWPENVDKLASLATGPIQWLTPSGSASPMPSPFFIRREGDSRMTLVDLNDVTISPVTYNFEIAVVYQGKTYTSPDPTIVNVQPPAAQLQGIEAPAQPAELHVS